jgi:hypothetical protein
MLALCVQPVAAQTEVMAWGNMTGVRVDGELIDFESSFRVVEKGWANMDYTGRERQNTRFTREGETTTVTSSVWKVNFVQTVTDKSKGLVNVGLTYKSDTTWNVEGVFYAFELPDRHYASGSVKIGSKTVQLAGLNGNSAKTSSKSINILGEGRDIKLNLSSSTPAFVRKEAGKPAMLYVQLMNGSLRKGKSGKLSFTITAAGEIDHEPVEIVVDRTNPGRLFVGMGGNFRLQNPRNDPEVIDYCLTNTRVAFGRAEMPWGTWQPQLNTDPLAEARAGKINERIDMAMKMAQRLGAQGMPVIISAWFPPQWSLVPNQPRRRGGIAALKLDPSKSQQIYKSMADYLVCLKDLYGVEAWAFSFNESDLGINVLHSAEEHRTFIKEFGAYLASRGLATKILLGDNSDATTFDFIVPAMNDPLAHEYIAAVSFHSWRGCDDETLKTWFGAAVKLNVPLIVGEGSTDAAAHRYSQIFLEPTFALYEINLYTRIAAICQPLSILQWQYTADYSLLWGNGIYGSEGPLRPTQRFWNIKQLASTPANSFSLPFTCSKQDVNPAAFGNLARGEYAIHMVNNGASRAAAIKGLPVGLSGIKAYATTDTMSMKEVPCRQAADGTLSVELPATGFVSIIIQ